MVSFGSSKQRSQSSSTAQTFVDPAQSGFLQQLRQGATNLQQQQQGQIGGLFDVAGGLAQQGQGFLNQLGGIQGQLQDIPGLQQFGAAGAGGFQAGLGQLGQQAAGSTPALQALQAQAFGQNPALGQQIGQLGQDINRQFQQQLPGITSQAVGGGQLGGGRQGVAQGLLGQSAIDAFQRGATELRGGDINRQLQAASQLAGFQGQAAGAQAQLGGQGFLGGGQLQQAGELGAGQLQLGAGLGGLQSLQGLFNLGLSPFQAQFGPLSSLAGIIGQPTTLSQQQQQATGKGSGFDFGILNFGSGSSSGGSGG